MDAKAKLLALELTTLLSAKPPNYRLIVGVCGIPASGKSVFADLLGKHLDSSIVAIVGLDGWHLTRAQLDQFADPQLARDRRGSHWTFDAASYLAFVKRLRYSPNDVITAPSFDHAQKDPVFDSVTIHPYHRIVIIEGLYTLLDADMWRDAAKILDERWYLEVTVKEAERRLVKRHVASGVAKDMEEAIWRAEQNDAPNGKFIIAHMIQPTKIISSVEDLTFAI